MARARLAFSLAQAVAFTSAITTLDLDIWHHYPSSTLSVTVLPDHSSLFKTADDVQWNVSCTQPCSRDELSTAHIHSQVPKIIHQRKWLQYIVLGMTAGFLLIKTFWVMCKESTRKSQYNATFAGLALAMLKTHCFVMLCIKTALNLALPACQRPHLTIMSLVTLPGCPWPNFHLFASSTTLLFFFCFCNWTSQMDPMAYADAPTWQWKHPS